MKSKIVLASDKDSFYYTKQRGNYDPETGILYVDEGDRAYGQTGFFADHDSVAYQGQFYLEREGSRLSWGNPNNTETFYDKY